MAFSDEISKVASSRFVLARLEPARLINSSLSSLGGNLYSATLDSFILSKIERSGVLLTKVTTPAADGQWSFNEDTGLLTIYSTIAPNSTTGIFIIYYYLFYSSDVDKIYPEGVTTGVARCWNGRISQTPSTSQSINNITSSFIVTSSTSSLTLSNADYDFQKYLTAYDSFANKNAESWMVVNGEISKIFTGKIVNIDTNANSINISLNDEFNRVLSENAYLGDDVGQAIATIDAYPNIVDIDINRPIPVIFGRSNQYNITNRSLVLSSESLLSGIQIDRSVSTTTHPLEFILCRIPNGVTLTRPTPSITLPQVRSAAKILISGGATLGARSTEPLQFNGDVTADIEVGQTFDYVTANGTSHAVVTKRVYNSLISKTQVDWYSDQTAFTFTGAVDITITGLTFSDKPAIMVKGLATEEVSTPYANGDGNSTNDDEWVALYSKHFTTSIIQQNNTKLLKIKFNANWFSTVMHKDRISSLTNHAFDELAYQAFKVDSFKTDFDRVKVFYKITTDEALSNHSDTLKFIVESSGISVNSSTFATAKSDLDSNVLFSIPFANSSTSLAPLKDYIQALLSSVVGVVYLDEESNLSYNLLSLPAAGDEIDENDILSNSLDVAVNYRDIITNVVYSNLHEPQKNFYIDKDIFPPPDLSSAEIYNCNISIEDFASKYLNKSEKTKFLEHVLQDITAGGRHLVYLALLSKRYATYKYSTSSQSLLNNIYDNVTLNDKIVLGGSNTVNCAIVALTKDEDKVDIIISDLFGL